MDPVNIDAPGASLAKPVDAAVRGEDVALAEPGAEVKRQLGLLAGLITRHPVQVMD